MNLAKLQLQTFLTTPLNIEPIIFRSFLLSAFKSITLLLDTTVVNTKFSLALIKISTSLNTNRYFKL